MTLSPFTNPLISIEYIHEIWMHIHKKVLNFFQSISIVHFKCTHTNIVYIFLKEMGSKNFVE